jgi:hypothetical protein
MAAIELNSTSLISDANLKQYNRFEGNSNATIGDNGSDTSVSYSSTDGLFGQYASFPATNGQKIQLTDAYTHALSGQDSFCMTMWVKATSLTGNVFWSRSGSWDTYGYVGGDGFIRFSYNGAYMDTASGALPTDTWTFLCFQKTTGTTGQIYVNGSQSGSDGTIGSTLTSSENINLGNYYDGDLSSYKFEGKIEDFAIFNRTLTTTEISNLYNGTWPSTTNATGFMTTNTLFWGS